MNTNFDPATQQADGVFTRVLSVIVALVVLTAAFMFSLVIFSVVAVVGLILWSYFWWKTRELRRQMREQVAEQMREQEMGGQTGGATGSQFGGRFNEPPVTRTDADGEVIEGEAVRVVEGRDRPAE